jgi:hypothetical protein
MLKADKMQDQGSMGAWANSGFPRARPTRKTSAIVWHIGFRSELIGTDRAVILILRSPNHALLLWSSFNYVEHSRKRKIHFGNSARP